MNILMIDDDRFTYAESMTWALRCEGHEVTWCRHVREVKYGWWEVGPKEQLWMIRSAIPNRVLVGLRPLLRQRFDTGEQFTSQVKERLGKRDFGEYGKPLVDKAHQDPLDPLPDCLLLDMMMPARDYYTTWETKAWKETGASLLRDREVRGKVRDVPVLVVTINRDPGLTTSLTQEFQQVKAVIYKPASGRQILARIKQIIP